MNVSHAKCLLGAAVVVGATAIALPSLSDAQETKPLDLRPPLRLEPPAAHPSAKPARPMPQSPVSPIEPVQAPQTVMPSNLGGGVQAEMLGVINPDVAGALSIANGGFGTDMWSGTRRDVIDQLMPQVPVTTASPAMRDLMRRVLLTGAEVPEGGEPGSLISLRAGLLSAMGEFGGVKALLDAIPGESSNPDLMRVEVDTRFLTGDVARACQMANAYIQERQSTYWQKAFIFCQAMEGEGNAALLGMSLLEELGVEDQVFFQLIERLASSESLSSETPTIVSLADPTPLHLALARVAKAKLPVDVISSNRPGVLRAIAISPNASPELRLEAAERAEVAGALPVDALRQLYASITFTDEQLKSPLTQAGQLSGPMSRALLYRATLMQTVGAAQAEALTQALSIARVGGRYASTARAFLPQLSRVQVTKDLAWFAPEAIRAFLISRRYADAKPWFDLLEESAVHEPEMAKALKALMPVARLSGFQGAEDWEMAGLTDWWLSVKDTPGARDKAATLAAALMALGEYVPEDIWADLLAGTSHTGLMAPHASHWCLLAGASSNGRVGETVLLSLVSLGDGGPARADPIVTHHVLRALRNVGLDREVRAMVLEAVVAAGL
ncbi:MAG: hypothetical protein OQK24_02520 [Magnetovibrio sp.]|nr:hypothetical protein [Magnetovibrio sp.]